MVRFSRTGFSSNNTIGDCQVGKGTEEGKMARKLIEIFAPSDIEIGDILVTRDSYYHSKQI